MKTPDLARRTLFLLLIAALPALPAAAAEPAESADLREATRPEQLRVDPSEGSDEGPAEVREEKGGYLGYRFLRNDGMGGRALEYGLLKSGKSGGLFYRHLEKERSFELEGDYLNEKEYAGDLLYDYRGDYRLHLRTESLFHNLDRQLLFAPDFSLPASFGGGSFAAAQQDTPATSYGVGVSQDLATFRYRLHDYPLHVNLGYWRLVREGTIQQRFADATFESPTNTVFAQPRHLDQQTQEGSVGLDAHLGWVDLVYLFQVRAFSDRAGTPVENYVPQLDPAVARAGGPMQHNENPDSRFISHTVKIHSTLSDGVVGAASYSVSTRENLSDLTDTIGVKHGKSTVQNAAGDFTYTPCKEFTAAFKYRRQDLDREGFTLLSNSFYGDPTAPRPGVESTRDIFSGTFSVRPAPNLSINAEYRGQLLNRSHVSAVPTASTWALPESSATQTGSLALFYRPVRGSRLTARYTYQSTDHPSFGSSFQQKHQGEVLGTYTGKKWGLSANFIVKREWNDEVERIVFLPVTPLVPVQQQSARERRSQNTSLNLWYAPTERINLTAQYAYLHTDIDQPVLFTSFVPPQTPAGFENLARVAGVGATLAATERVDFALTLQRIWSSSSFDPQLIFGAANSGELDTTGISGITGQNTTITRFSARSGFRFTKELAATAEYTLRDYNEKNPLYSSSYNGTVHTVVAYLSTKW